MKKNLKITSILLGIYFLVGIVLTAFVLLSPNGGVYYSSPAYIIFNVIAWPLWANSFVACGDFGCLQIN